MKISYLNNPFNNDFSNFNVFLTNFTSFGDLSSFRGLLSVMRCHLPCLLEASHLTFNESQLTGLSMMQVFTERRLQTDFHFRLMLMLLLLLSVI